MWLSNVSLRVESGDRVEVHYSPPRTTQYGSGHQVRQPGLVHVYVGEVALFAPPTEMVEVLGRALRECYAAWGGGPDDPEGGAAAASTPPPIAEAVPIGDQPSAGVEGGRPTEEGGER